MNWTSFKNVLENSVGIEEHTILHEGIVTSYNMINPLPRGYKATTDDPWCAIFVSAMWHSYMDGWFPYECSCRKMIAKAKANNSFVANDFVNQVKEGYLIFYDWERDGDPDHVGYITSINGLNEYTVIEGNWNNKVTRRLVDRFSPKIAGFAALSYPDASPKTEFDLAKEWAREIELMLGDGTDSYWQTPPTREQLAVILKRLCNTF